MHPAESPPPPPCSVLTCGTAWQLAHWKPNEVCAITKSTHHQDERIGPLGVAHSISSHAAPLGSRPCVFEAEAGSSAPRWKTIMVMHTTRRLRTTQPKAAYPSNLLESKQRSRRSRRSRKTPAKNGTRRRHDSADSGTTPQRSRRETSRRSRSMAKHSTAQQRHPLCNITTHISGGVGGVAHLQFYVQKIRRTGTCQGAIGVVGVGGVNKTLQNMGRPHATAESHQNQRSRGMPSDP